MLNPTTQYKFFSIGVQIMLLKALIEKILYFDPFLNGLFGDRTAKILLRFKATQFLMWRRKLEDRIYPVFSHNLIDLYNQFCLWYFLLISKIH